MQTERNGSSVRVGWLVNLRVFGLFQREAGAADDAAEDNAFPIRAVELKHARVPVEDHVDAAVKQAVKIHLGGMEGDILIFMPGQEDIEVSPNICFGFINSFFHSFPWGSLPSPFFAKAPLLFSYRTDPPLLSKVLSLCVFVVDPGYCKLKVFNPKIGMDTLQIFPVSQASANQRSGRAGRTGPGHCYRPYTERQFKDEMLVSTVPEIQRTNLANVVLLLKSLNVDDLLLFHFMDSPPMDRRMEMISLFRCQILFPTFLTNFNGNYPTKG
ncbi:hypothetical protein niasHT_025683 [Heterodera trifolii]|uniref:Helicase C-terminal domain-containing protein n=1 Tax=Heterodera trifolii TaxID=157864 RepID=A0ABD2JWE2_9BILA